MMGGVSPERECQCSLRIRLVGDGCSVCNPGYLADVLSDEDAPIPYTLTEAGKAALDGGE